MLWLLACGGSVESPVELLAEGPELHGEVLAEGVSLARHAWPSGVVLQGDPLTLWDARDFAHSELDLYGETHGALLAVLDIPEALLIAVGDELWAWDGTLWPSPMQDQLSGPFQQLSAGDDGDIWLLSDGVYRWRAGDLTSFDVDGVQATGPLATGGLLDRQAVTWIGSGGWAVALDHAGQAVDSTRFAAVESLAVDAAGHAWLSDGEDLWIRAPRSSAWQPLQLDGVAQVIAGADMVWVQTDEGAWAGSAAGLGPVELPQGTWQGVDDWGRLLVATGDGIERFSPGRWARFLDLPDVLEGTVVVTLEVSTAEGVDEVSVTVNGAVTSLEGPPWLLDLTESEGIDGVVTLTASIGWSGGEQASASASVAVDTQGNRPTWEDTIEPLFQDRCSACHGTGASTELANQEDWVSLIDVILLQVETQEMPQSGAPLSDQEIGWIRDWRESGFP
jgi:hypothetical protein